MDGFPELSSPLTFHPVRGYFHVKYDGFLPLLPLPLGEGGVRAPMSLTPGAKLGPYEILAPLGAGGMGEVYKARDTRLERTVAIKVLPSHVASNPEVRQRFEREARAVSSLNHPHICTLHDIGSENGIDFLVMEHIEGDTLAARLKKGALPLDQALQYAVEIADALDKAHRQGVVHRDLKPGNIMLAKSGAKLLDFGLAKMTAEQTNAAGLSALPTEAKPLTQEGSILGTFQYMAPEQLEGKEADARTDIFAFGAVTYEMLTGKRAFEGKSQASLIGAIMNSEPPALSSLQPMTPSALDRVIKKCLSKEPDSRWQTASDLHDELKWIAEGGLTSAIPSAGTAMPAPKLWQQAIPFVMVAVLAAAIACLVVWNLKSSTTIWPEVQFTVALPSDEHLEGLEDMSPVAVSPNGSSFVYVANRDGVQQLFLRSLDSLEARPISGTEDGTGPFFSPDGLWLGFFAGGHLKKVPIAGGRPTVLAPAPLSRGGSWGNDGQIIFAPQVSGGLERVSASGGKPDLLTTPDSDEGVTIHRFPQHLPGAKAILFTVGTDGSWDDALIVAQRLDTGERKILIEGGSDARYVPTGHLVYVRAGALMAAPFDLDRLEVTGPSVAIVEGVMQSTNITGAAFFGFSDLGWLVYVPGTGKASEKMLVWVDRKGEEQPLPVPPQPYESPSLSPDGERLAVHLNQGNQVDIWVYDIPRGALTRLTFEGNNLNPVWTPDGGKVTFESFRAGRRSNLFWKSGDGSGTAERLTTNERDQFPSSWSRDGQFLAFSQGSGVGSSTGYDIWILPLEGERKPWPFLQTPFNEEEPEFSPDGRWLAYQSDESGQYEVYVRPFPKAEEGKEQISTEGGTEPVWAGNGELFYRNGDQMMAVDITTEPSLSAGPPRLLFEGRYDVGPAPLVTSYDVTSDGQRFLMIKTDEEEATQLNVTLNWFEELKRLVPTEN